MEPVKVSIFDKDSHLATVARNRQGDYVASTEAIGNDVKTAQASTRATLYTSFYHAALEQHIAPDTILKLLRVHSYDVDFKQKVKAGDTFEMFFDGASDDEVGELLYTSMTIDDQARKFYRFRTPDDVVDYYDEQGNSAKKFLMRNPVKGGRYTSGFGARNHPLLRYMRQHTGVDWAAPTGTPILAAGDGTVERVGREGGYGNYVRIRHANGFATAYGHMTRFAAGVEPGVTVKQGQIIGFVGSTGMSTGPHCHFEVLVNNSFVNPMTIQVPRGLQLTGRQLAEFQRERKRIEGADADGPGHEPRRPSLQLTSLQLNSLLSLSSLLLSLPPFCVARFVVAACGAIPRSLLSPLGRGLSAAILPAKPGKSHGGKGEGGTSACTPISRPPHPASGRTFAVLSPRGRGLGLDAPLRICFSRPAQSVSPGLARES